MTYTEADIAGKMTAMLDAADAASLFTPEQTGLLDQFHAGGVGAVDKLIPSLALSPGDSVIDIGSGFGGPARRVAEQTGATVVGIDITPAYIEAAQTLTARMGFTDRVCFQHADILTLSVPRPFDAALTMHVQMNVEDKRAWFAAIAKVLAPGGRLAVWEVCTTTGGQPAWPAPWSLDGSDSFLATADDLQDAITTAGFDVLEWHDETAWVNQWSAATLGDDVPRVGLVLPMVIDDGITRVVNFSTALKDGTLTVIRGAFARAATDSWRR
jgi:cyclopropane fatty-acyl-phospholipid synthase-like methyltransferase